MNKQLIPIIAAYWGAECSYEDDWRHSQHDRLDSYELEAIQHGKLLSFKLHLRPLWSITEEELRELGEVLGLDGIEVRIDLRGYESTKILKERGYSKNEICIYDDENLTIHSAQAPQLINHLRAKGFCIDQELVDAGLVEWV